MNSHWNFYSGLWLFLILKRILYQKRQKNWYKRCFQKASYFLEFNKNNFVFLKVSLVNFSTKNIGSKVFFGKSLFFFWIVFEFLFFTFISAHIAMRLVVFVFDYTIANCILNFEKIQQKGGLNWPWSRPLSNHASPTPRFQ